MADPEVVEEGREETGTAAAAPKKKVAVNPVVVIAAGAVAAAVILAVILVRILAPKPAPVEEGATPAATAAAPAAAGKSAQPLGTLYTYDKPIVVNLAESNAERYLKVGLTLEVDKAEVPAELRSREPQILDLLINILSAKALADISSTAGRNMVRQEIIDKINAVLQNGRIRNIYFTDFVVQ
ncbi:MAG: flagellar basal body-associated FliL family protein [Candidatus Omnitrophica bacterium]|nr:flagellar basal body-associated FliL family protein [Candidatus Omnitrophota bacterium]